MMMGTIGELARRVLAAAGAGSDGSAREQLAHELFDWHGGQTSGLHAVGEAWLRGADAPPNEVDRALSELQSLLDDEVPSPGERRHVADLKARLETERRVAKTAGAMKRSLEALSEEMGFGGAINDDVVAEGQRRLTSGLPPFGPAREVDGKYPEGGATMSRYHDAVGRTGPGTPATGIGQSVEETATGCVGADSYKGFAARNGYGHLEVLNWTSSAGDWQFIVSKDGKRWRVLFQENNYPRPGFSHTLSDEEYEGTAEEVFRILEQEY
jgi:hypothetical protein